MYDESKKVPYMVEQNYYQNFLVAKDPILFLKELTRIESEQALDYAKREAFYKSTAWTHQRQAVLRRDNFECQLCKRFGRVGVGSLVVHHMTTLEHNASQRLNNNNLLTLCNACHNSVHATNAKANRWTDELDVI